MNSGKFGFGIMYLHNHNQDIIELLERLKQLRTEYPADLMSARRVLFILLLDRYTVALI